MVRKTLKQKTLPFEKVTDTNLGGESGMAEGTSDSDALVADSDPLATILKEMRSGFRSLDTRFDALEKRMDTMNNKIQSHDRRLDAAETRISDTEDGASKALQRLERVEHILKDVAIKNEDLEARGRRNNIRLLGVPESTNTGRLDVFIERLLADLFGRDSFTQGFVVERAHRSLGPRPAPGLNPRPIIARLLNFRDRDTALRLAQDKGDIVWQGSRLSLFPDFTVLVQEARRKFTDVKATLRKLGLRYGMLYPARLSVDINGRPRIFESPAAAQEFCRSYKSSATSSSAEQAIHSPPGSDSNASAELFTNNSTG